MGTATQIASADPTWRVHKAFALDPPLQSTEYISTGHGGVDEVITYHEHVVLIEGQDDTDTTRAYPASPEGDITSWLSVDDLNGDQSIAYLLRLMGYDTVEWLDGKLTVWAGERA